MTNTQSRITSLPLKVFLIFAHIIGAIVAILGVGVLLIAVYHTSIFLVASAWSPVFMFILPTVTLALSLGVIFLKQPVHSLLCLIGVFFSAALLYLYVGAEFLAFLFLIVYVGAIAILFLFVIMLLHLKPILAGALLITSGFAWFMYPSAIFVTTGLDDAVAYGISTFFVASDTLVFKTALNSADNLVWFVNSRFSDILLFSDLLYTYHCFLFFVAALLLLTAMLGAIILATSATDLKEKTLAAIDPVTVIVFFAVICVFAGPTSATELPPGRSEPFPLPDTEWHGIKMEGAENSIFEKENEDTLFEDTPLGFVTILAAACVLTYLGSRNRRGGW